MNIVFYYPKRLPVREYGGIERVIVWLIKGLTELGHNVTFIGPEGSSVPCSLNVVWPFDSVDVPDAAMFREVLPPGTDLIHFNGDHTFTGDYGVPFVVTMHGAVKGAEGLGRNYCFISDAQRRYWNYPENPMVHNGVDKDDYIYRSEKDDYVLFLSRIDWEVKGLDRAIEAAAKAESRLIIAGNVHRKSFVNSYFRGYLKKRLSDRVHYAGPVGGELKAMLLAKARALVFPTRWCEPFGLVVTESLASGTPVITTRNGAMPEIVEDGRTGFLCDDTDEMAEAIRRVGDLRAEDCRNAVEKKFNHMRMAAEYVELYRAVIDDARRS